LGKLINKTNNIIMLDEKEKKEQEEKEKQRRANEARKYCK